MRRPFLLLATLLLLTGVAAAAPTAPGFKVRTLDGHTVDSKGLIGQKVIVLRFQASYCKPCVKESPELSRVLERYRDRDVEIIAVHVQDTAADTRRFIDQTKATYPVVLDPRVNLGNRFGFRGTPFTVVIDRKGEIAARVHGEGVVRRLPRTLDGLLKQDPQ